MSKHRAVQLRVPARVTVLSNFTAAAAAPSSNPGSIVTFLVPSHHHSERWSGEAQVRPLQSNRSGHEELERMPLSFSVTPLDLSIFHAKPPEAATTSMELTHSVSPPTQSCKLLLIPSVNGVLSRCSMPAHRNIFEMPSVVTCTNKSSTGSVPLIFVRKSSSRIALMPQKVWCQGTPAPLV